MVLGNLLFSYYGAAGVSEMQVGLLKISTVNGLISFSSVVFLFVLFVCFWCVFLLCARHFSH